LICKNYIIKALNLHCKKNRNRKYNYELKDIGLDMNDNENYTKSVVLIGAHFDDCEGGHACGTCLKLKKLGYRIVFINTMAPTWGYLNTHTKKELEIFHAESTKAAELLGVEKILINYSAPPSSVPDPILTEKIAEILWNINPEFVFIPWVKDNHVDHEKTSRSAFDAIRYPHRFIGNLKVRLKGILAYHISTWQTVGFSPDFTVDITQELKQCEEALRAFKHLGWIENYISESRNILEQWGGNKGRFAEGFKHLGPGFAINSSLPLLLGDTLSASGSIHYPWGAKYFQN
jgi:LmbE family N-acetylglucosaminyl deacetylase